MNGGDEVGLELDSHVVSRPPHTLPPLLPLKLLTGSRVTSCTWSSPRSWDKFCMSCKFNLFLMFSTNLAAGSRSVLPAAAKAGLTGEGGGAGGRGRGAGAGGRARIFAAAVPLRRQLLGG